jgi:SAM-dependent methyltransferase
VKNRPWRSPDRRAQSVIYSDDLMDFTNQAKWARTPHLAFLTEMASSLSPGASVLDVGSGDSPYRELFREQRYVTCDWENSQYHPSGGVDIVATAGQIPVDDDSFDAVLNTQVLEHVENPDEVLRELFRLLKPGGGIWITAPLVWFLHEEPYDYWRYTNHGLRSLLDAAGFVGIEIKPLNDCFSTLAQLISEAAYMMGGNATEEELAIQERMKTIAEEVASYSAFDKKWIFPINFGATARKP